jgi:hypothetical protein
MEVAFQIPLDLAWNRRFKLGHHFFDLLMGTLQQGRMGAIAFRVIEQIAGEKFVC